MFRRNIPNLLKQLNYNLLKPVNSLHQQFSGSATVLRSRINVEENNTYEQWNRLYILEEMKYLAIVTKLKLYPFFLTALGVPFTGALQVTQIHPVFDVIPVAITGIVSTSILAAFSQTLSNTIGIIEVCPDNKNVKLLYIDFMGRQCTKIIKIIDLKKCEKSMLKLNLYKTVKVKDDNGEICLKIPTNRGTIYDVTLFKKLFGK